MEEPALLIKTAHNRLNDSLADDAVTAHDTGGSSAARKSGDKSGSGGGSGAPPKKLKRDPAQRVHKVGPNGHFLANRNDIALCGDFNQGKCDGKYLQCPKYPSKVHQCSKCLLQGHGAHNCQKGFAKNLQKDGGKGGKGGKGGGKKQHQY